MENQEYPNRRHYGYEVESFLKIIYRFTQKTSMLVTDVEDKIYVLCWWQGLVAGDGFGHFGHQYLRIIYASSTFSPGLKYCHQHYSKMTTLRCCWQIDSDIRSMSPFWQKYLSCRDSRDCFSSTEKFILAKTILEF